MLAFLSVAVFTALTSCGNDVGSSHLNISRALVSAANGNSRSVSVIISQEDFRYLTDNEIYASVVVVSCRDSKQRYPMETYVGAVSLDDFKAARAIAQRTQSNDIELSGTVPKNFLLRIAEPCAKLEGGSYSGRTITSNILRIVSQSL